MNEFLHILDRFIIHFFASMSLVLIVFFALRTTARKIRGAWLPHEWRHNLILSAVIVFAISTLRESYDVGQGQLVAKALTDYISWLTGCGVSVWGLYRFKVDSDT